MTRTRTARRALVAGLVTLTLGLAACGDDDGDGADSSEEPAAPGGTAAPSDDTAPVTEPLPTLAIEDVDLDAYAAEAAERLKFQDDAAALCVGTGMITAIGAERIAATGLGVDSFFSTANFAATGIEVTDELRAEMEAEVAQCDGLVEELVNAEFGDDTELAECVAAELDDAIVANWLISGLTQGEPSEAAIEARTNAQACAPTPTTVTATTGS